MIKEPANIVTRRDHLDSLNYLSRSVMALQSSQSVAQLVLTRIQRLVPYARGSVMEFNLHTRKAGLLAIQMDYKTKVEPEVQLSLDTLDVNFESKLRVQLIQDLQNVQNPSAIEKQLCDEGIRSVITVPLYSGKELVGLLNLGSKEKNAFVPSVVEAIEDMTVILTIAIHQSRLSEQTKKDTHTKTMLVDEINHRVKNNLSAIIGLLYAKQSSFDSTRKLNADDTIHELVTSIQGMSTVHQMLSAAEWSPLALSDLAIRIISSVLNITVDKHIPFDVTPSAITVIPSQANSIALVINELTINFTKHALPVKGHARIRVTINEKNGNIVFRFSDDGPGFPEPVVKENRHSTGLYLVTEIVKNNLKGDIKLESRAGAQIEITFPSISGET
jgi:two-component sensor histidine kinase